MQLLERKKKKKNIVFRAVLAVAVLIAFVNVLYVFVQQRSSIRERQAELDRLSSELEAQVVANEELRSLSENEDLSEYMEKVARDSYNYVYPGEHVYQNIAGIN